MSLKVVLMGLFHESNTFITTPTTYEHFINGHLLMGEAIRKEYKDAHHEIGGMLEIMDEEEIEVIPVMFAEATPGGIISSQTYDRLLSEMVNELDKVLPVDGCLIVAHGAAVCESFPDMDGHWLSVLRKKIGERKPIIGTLDPHANLSGLMVSSTDGLFAYKTNPHIDQRETGKEAARFMVNVLNGKCKPVQLFFAMPLVISIEKQNTGSEPCKSLYAYVDELSRLKNILSISILIGFPYADVLEMGTSFLVITENDSETALDAGRKAVQFIFKHIDQFKSSLKEIGDLLLIIKESEKPILMLDMGDNIGGGAPGNSTFLLEVLDNVKNCRVFICLYDPGAVLQAEKNKVGERFELFIQQEERKTSVYSCNATLLKLADGRFKETLPRHSGQLNYDMGRIAVVSTPKSNIIMLTSLRVPPFSLNQLINFEIDPKDFDVIVAKGVNAPIAAYAPVCPTIMQADSPGITRADLRKFSYNNRRRPMFPFEEINPNAYEI